MAQPNGLNPEFGGPVKAQGFITPLETSQTIRVATNGTTRVNVLAATHPFTGTFKGIRVISSDDSNGTITFNNNVDGTQSAVAVIIKGSAGVFKGSAFAPVAFKYGGTSTIESSSATGNAVVEVEFTQFYPT